MKKVKSLKLNFNYTYLLLGFLALVLIVFTITKPEMLWKGSVWMSMAKQFPESGVFVIGVMFCFIAGYIDISFVTLADLSAIIACMYMARAGQGNPTALSSGMIVITGVLIALLIGALGGLINGNLVSRIGIPAIMATLANQMVFRGLSIVLTRGNAVMGIPSIYGEVMHTKIFGFIPMALLVFILVLLISAFLLKYTIFGKKLYMLGSNAKAAKFSAINITRMTNITFVISGICAAIGGMLMVATMNSAKADYGSSY